MQRRRWATPAFFFASLHRLLLACAAAEGEAFVFLLRLLRKPKAVKQSKAGMQSGERSKQSCMPAEGGKQAGGVAKDCIFCSACHRLRRAACLLRFAGGEASKPEV
jgi:hypothetical protein